jgi:hypothetical protein
MPHNQIDNIKNENGGVININNSTHKKKYYIIILILILLIIILGINNKDNPTYNTTKGENSPNISDNSGNIVLDYSTKVFSEKKEDNILEFIDILKLFTIPYKESYNALEWERGANSKINWLHKGLKDFELIENNRFLPNFLGCYIREGKIKITNNGYPSHKVLKEKMVPVEWFILLSGARAGITSIYLFNKTSAYLEEGQLIIPERFIRDKKDICINEEFISEPYIDTLYKVSFEETKPIWVIENYHSGGVRSLTDYSYTIFINEPTQDEVIESTKDCREFKSIK